MEKQKLQALYTLLGITVFLLFNYPVIQLMRGKVWMGVPALLVYFGGVVLAIAGLGFLISRLKEEQ